MKSISEILARHGEIKLGIVFGSAASDTLRSTSDLDVAVAADRPLKAQIIRGLIEDLAQASGRPVDLVDLNTAGQPILAQVLTKGRVVYCTDHALYGELIKKMLFETADFAPYRERILTERRKAWIGA